LPLTGIKRADVTITVISLRRLLLDTSNLVTDLKWLSLPLPEMKKTFQNLTRSSCIAEEPRDSTEIMSTAALLHNFMTSSLAWITLRVYRSALAALSPTVTFYSVACTVLYAY